MKRRVLLLFILTVLSLTAKGAGGEDNAPVQMGSRLELFVDDFLIERMSGVSLRLHPPRIAEKVVTFDQPWEGPSSAYVTVFQDGDLYKMYYRGSSGPVPEGNPWEVTCYAESRDGIHWTKPVLHLHEFRGSKSNNIVWTGEGVHNFAPFKDTRPGVPASEQYKAVGRPAGSGKRKRTLIGFVSPDGLHWKKASEEPLLTDGAFDSLNVAFWDSVRGHYVAFYREFYRGFRWIRYSTSSDFLHWAPGTRADFGQAPMEHLYTNATVAYFRAPHIYLAFPKRFVTYRRNPVLETHPSASQYDVITLGVSDGVMMSSRDGVHWNRFLEAFIRPGRDSLNWSDRSNMVAWGILPTTPDEISLYVSQRFHYPSSHLRRAVLRTDGFVSVHAGVPGGAFVTKLLTFKGRQLVLNYATSAAGSIRVEILDANGLPISGFGREESPVLFGDRIAHAVPWKSDAPGRFQGTPVRLRFLLRDADLYSLQFKE